MKLEHIGIALRDKNAIELFERLLNASPYKTEAVDLEGVTTTFFGDSGEPDAAPKMELLEATSEDSPLQRFVDRRGDRKSVV